MRKHLRIEGVLLAGIVGFVVLALIIGAVLYFFQLFSFQSQYFTIDYLNGQRLWVQRNGKQLRMATRVADLPKATWISAIRTHDESMEFPWIVLPGAPKSSVWDSVEVSLLLSPISCSSIHWRLMKRAQDGTHWKYLASGGSCLLSTNLKQTETFYYPAAGVVKAEVYPFVDTSSQPMKVMLRPLLLFQLPLSQTSPLPNSSLSIYAITGSPGAGVVMMQLFDTQGTAVVTTTVPLDKAETWPLTLPASTLRPWPYTCAWSIDTGPLAGVVTASGPIP